MDKFPSHSASQEEDTATDAELKSTVKCVSYERSEQALGKTKVTKEGLSFEEIKATLKDERIKRKSGIEKRIQLLEYRTYYPSFVSYPSESENEQVIRARRAALSLKMYSVKFQWVPYHYYSLSILQRAQILGAHSTKQLCKSMLLENKAFDASLLLPQRDDIQTEFASQSMYSQFYLVILQYDATISMKKLQSEIRALMPVTKRFEPSKFEFRVASEQDNDRLTGYLHNAVTPFGMKERVPIILAKAIVGNTHGMNRFIWMGGGHVHLKIGVAVTELLDAMKPLVLDVTEPRIDDELL